ncbi:MAG: AAA family ATPase [Alphaproteobacteria bacterium]|jgi:uncharacterized protein YhaN|nr:AAA family ATPase [Alphaproteobacteria bacterium]
MRLRALHLDRFGPFTDRRLDFDGDADLWLVAGPNEAGKSSALAALIDLLFGIEPRTAYAFRHGYDRLRLGGAIANGAGADLVFRRRKGNRNTLLDPDDRALPDEALAPFLGRADRDLFTRAFGLDHDRLRQGGEQLLAARGDIGESLLEAGAGLASLVALHKRLQDRADGLFTPQRKVASKPLDAALKRADEARKAIRSDSLKAEDWQAAQEALAAAEHKRDELRRQHAALSAESARVNRVLRVQPVLARLDRLAAEHAALAGVPDLPEDFDRRRLTALQARARAEDDLARLAEAIARLQAQHDGLAVPEALLARAGDIEATQERRAVIRAARDDLPNRREETRREEDALARLAVRLGLPADTDLAARRPADPELAEIRRLIRTGTERLEAKAAAARRERQARSALDEAERTLATLPEPAKPPPLRRQLEQLRPVTDDAAGLPALEAEAAAQAAALAEKLAALPLWAGDAEALAAAPLPGRETVRRFRGEAESLARRRDRLAEDLAAAETEGEAARSELSRLAAAGEVPTPEAVRDARRRRDRCWRLLRRGAFDGGPPPDLEERTEFAAGHSLPDAYEDLVAAADSLVDRREAEARRIQEYAAATARAETAAARLVDLAAKREALDRDRERHDAAWRAAWAPAGLDPLPPGEMEDWLDARAAVLTVREALARHRVAATALADRLEGARAALAAMAAALDRDTGAGENLPALFQAVEEAVESLEAQAEAWRAARQARDQAAETVRRAAADLAEADAAITVWREAWAAAMPRLGLAPEAGLEQAEAALAVWADVPVHRKALADLGHRIRRIAENEAAFSATVRALAADLDPSLAEADPVDAADRLFQALQEARKAEAQRRRLATELAAARTDEETARKARDAARADMAALLDMAAAETPEALDGLAEKAARKRKLAAEMDAAQAELLRAGAGPDEAALRSEAAEADPDAFQARAATLQAELAEVVAALEAAGQAVAGCRGEADRLAALGGAGQAAQDWQDALTDVRRHAEDWVRHRIAALMLKAAIERYREENQSPMLQRAGGVFAQLTCGSFAGLAVDYDERDDPRLVGERPGEDGEPGERVRVEGMSDGTRDQLYLALRIAAIELYCRQAEPLPFIGDDLFIHFDDDRAAAGLAALADLGRQAPCQVILFTHHTHLVDLARSRLGARVAVLTL